MLVYKDWILKEKPDLISFWIGNEEIGSIDEYYS